MPEHERDAGSEAAQAIMSAGFDLADQAVDKLYQGTKKESLAAKMARAEKQRQEQLAAHKIRQQQQGITPGGKPAPSFPNPFER